MENSCFFTPAAFSMEGISQKARNQLGNICLFYENTKPFPNLNSFDIAIIGAEEDRYSRNNNGSAFASGKVREYLYSLYTGPTRPRIADLGNISKGHSVSDTHFAVQEVISELVANDKSVIIIGGSHDLTYGIYKAFARLNKVINIVAVDRKIDHDLYDSRFHSESYLKEMISQQPNFLFNFSNIGHQTYFTDQDVLRLMDNLYFDLYRLGMVRKAIHETEAIIRNTDVISFDISAARASEAPGHAAATPNGFTGEEMCQLARYAGFSEKLSVAGFFEYNPSYDKEGITAHLLAQMIWYFIEGYYLRTTEDPSEPSEDFIKYFVPVREHQQGIVFFRSKNTDRWWMEVGSRHNIKPEYRRHNVIPCTYSDYQTACNNDIPDRWWKAYQKLM